MASQVDAARNLLPYAVDVALKDVRLYPNRSNSVTIWGKPIGDGSVDYDTILPLLHQLLPDPDNTSCHIKLRLSPDTTLDDTHAWMSRSAPAGPHPPPPLAGRTAPCARSRRRGLGAGRSASCRASAFSRASATSPSTSWSAAAWGATANL